MLSVLASVLWSLISILFTPAVVWLPRQVRRIGTRISRQHHAARGEEYGRVEKGAARLPEIIVLMIIRRWPQASADARPRPHGRRARGRRSQCRYAFLAVVLLYLFPRDVAGGVVQVDVCMLGEHCCAVFRLRGVRWCA